MPTGTWRKALREPLLHFAVLGAALFALYGWMRPVEAAGPEQIVVDAGRIDSLATGFARAWRRAPAPDELRGLIDDYVEEEVLAREAIALGLDRDDTVVRRRLRQKMEFLVEDVADLDEPDEDELREYLRSHAADFAEETRTSFRHVFLGEDEGEASAAEAARTLARLRTEGLEADVAGHGRRLLLPSELVLEPRRGIAALLGDAFAAALEELPVGEWTGPVASSYGTHLVLVLERAEGRAPELDRVRDAVVREIVAERRARARRELVESLLERYEVTVEWPSLPDEDGAPDGGAGG